MSSRIIKDCVEKPERFHVIDHEVKHPLPQWYWDEDVAFV